MIPFSAALQSFFADTPYEMIRDLELHYQNVLFIVFKLVGFYVKVEYHTSEARGFGSADRQIYLRNGVQVKRYSGGNLATDQ